MLIAYVENACRHYNSNINFTEIIYLDYDVMPQVLVAPSVAFFQNSFDNPEQIV